MKSGRFDEVLGFLKNASAKAGQNLLYTKIIQQVVSRLVLRLGLPHALALNLARILVPVIINKLEKKALLSGKIQHLFSILGINDRLDKLTILKQQLSQKFTFKQPVK